MITTTPKIGLRISGTKQRRGGFQPLVAVGVLAGNEANNMDRVTLVAEKPAYVVKHTSEYVLYMLIDRRVKSFDADAPGVLSIALTIASDAQLANQKSPYSLLKDVYDKFVNTYMTRLSDGRDSFIDCDADTEVFREIVERYPLDEMPRTRPFMPMNPQGSTGTICVPSNKLEAFFRDTDYEEFRKFCDIEVGTECVNSSGLENLEIPKITKYEVWINGTKIDRKLRPIEGENSLSCQLPGYPPVSFTLDALLSAPGHSIESPDATIVLNPLKNRITCTIKKQVETNRLVFRWDTDDVGTKSDVVSMIKSHKVRILLDGNDVSEYAVSDKQCEVDSDKADKLFVSIMPKSTHKYVFDATKEMVSHDGKKLLQITIQVRRKPAVGITLKGEAKNNDGKTGSSRGQGTSGNYSGDSSDRGSNLPSKFERQPNQGKKEKNIPWYKKYKSYILVLLCGIILGGSIAFLASRFLGEKKNSQVDKKISTLTDSINSRYKDKDSYNKTDSIINGSKPPINNPKPKDSITHKIIFESRSARNKKEKQESKPNPKDALLKKIDKTITNLGENPKSKSLSQLKKNIIKNEINIKDAENMYNSIMSVEQ